MMNSDKKKLGIWTLAGALVCLALIPAITEANGFQIYLNIAAFLGIYFGGVLAITVVSWLKFRIQKKTLGSVATIAIKASQAMIGTMVIFGLYFYDFSQARPHSYFSKYDYQYTVPSATVDGWETADAREFGIDTSLLTTITERFVNDENYKWQHSFLLTKNGKLIVEEYFYDNDNNTLHDLRSANKSVTSILLGVAIQNGFIRSENEPLASFLPEYADIFAASPKKGDIRLKDLLTMQSGLDANDWNRTSPGNENRIYNIDGDWIRYFLELDVVNEPGSSFAYATMGEMTLRQVIANASKMPFSQFAERFLFKPLGIHNVNWTHFLESRPDVAYRVELTSRDLAKLGQLYLNQGLWNGQWLISSDWVNRSTSKHTTTTEKRLGFPDYGYLWWKHKFQVGDRMVEGFQAQGNGGQFIFVIPELAVTAVFTSRNFGRRRQINPINIMRSELIPLLVQSQNAAK